MPPPHPALKTHGFQGATAPWQGGFGRDGVPPATPYAASAAPPAMSRPTASATRMPSTPAEKMPPA